MTISIGESRRSVVNVNMCVAADEIRKKDNATVPLNDLKNVMGYVKHLEAELRKAGVSEEAFVASGGWSTPADKAYDLTPSAKKAVDYMSQGYTFTTRRVRYGNRYWTDWTAKRGGVQIAEGSDLSSADADRHLVQVFEQDIKRRKELNRKETAYHAESGRRYLFSHEVKRAMFGGMEYSVWNAEGKMISTGIARFRDDADKAIMRTMKEWVKDKEGSKPVHQKVGTVRGDRTYNHSYVVIDRGAGEFSWSAFADHETKHAVTTLPIGSGKASSLALAEAQAKFKINEDCNNREIKLSVEALKKQYTEIPLPPRHWL